MSKVDSLPSDPAGKLAYLRRAASHGEALSSLLAVGGPVEPLCAYLGANPDLAAERTGRHFVIGFGRFVRWDFRVGDDERILGYGTSGYGPLMAALGVDFSGRPYVEGNG